MENLEILNTADKKGKYSYVVKGNRAELADLSGTKVTFFTNFKNQKDNKYIAFASIAMLGESKMIAEITGFCQTGSQRRAELLSLLKGMEVLSQNDDTNFGLDIYLSEDWSLRMLTNGWGARWRANGYCNALGNVIRNKDFVEPLAEILYGKKLMRTVEKIRNLRDLPNETRFEIKCVSRINQLLRIGYQYEA